jgi:outer membrane protein TolC
MNIFNKKIRYIIPMFLVAFGLNAQNWTLQQCIDKAVASSTSTKQLAMIQEELQLKNQVANINNLPKLSLNGAATYQTDVTSLPISIPGIVVPLPQKDQYKVTLDLQQNIWDGGLSKNTKKRNSINSEVDNAQMKVDNYIIEEQVTQLYYTISLIDKQSDNIEYIEKQLNTKLQKVDNNYINGTVAKADLLQIKASIIELNQQKSELAFNRKATISALNIWMREELPATFAPTVTESVTINYDDKIDRPEIQLLKSKQSLLLANQDLLQCKYNPKISLFGTAGYGRPGLNFLARDFALYGIGGLNVRIPIDQYIFGTNNKEKNILQTQSNRINQQIEQFDLKQKAQLAAKKAEIERLESSIKTDQELITIKTSLKEIADVRNTEGVINTAEYTEALQAELIAKNNLALHSTQLALAKKQFLLIKGI